MTDWDPPSPLHLEGIGRVARACALLEFTQHQLTSALVASDPLVSGALTSPADSFGQSQKVARALTSARFGGVDKPDGYPYLHYPHPMATALVTWMNAARRLVDDRNVYLHSIWGQDGNQQIGVMVLRSPSRTRPVSLADLERVELEMRNRIDESVPLIQRVAAEVLAREKTVQALLDERIPG